MTTSNQELRQISLLKWRLILGKKAEKNDIKLDNLPPDILNNFMRGRPPPPGTAATAAQGLPAAGELIENRCQ